MRIHIKSNSPNRDSSLPLKLHTLSSPSPSVARSRYHRHPPPLFLGTSTKPSPPIYIAFPSPFPLNTSHLAFLPTPLNPLPKSSYLNPSPPLRPTHSHHSFPSSLSSPPNLAHSNLPSPALSPPSQPTSQHLPSPPHVNPPIIHHPSPPQKPLSYTHPTQTHQSQPSQSSERERACLSGVDSGDPSRRVIQLVRLASGLDLRRQERWRSRRPYSTPDLYSTHCSCSQSCLLLPPISFHAAPLLYLNASSSREPRAQNPNDITEQPPSRPSTLHLPQRGVLEGVQFLGSRIVACLFACVDAGTCSCLLVWLVLR